MEKEFLEALSFQRESQYEEAESLYLATLETDPDDIRVQFLLGTLYMQQEKIDQALHYLNKVVEKNPDHGPAFYNIALGYFFREEWVKADDNFAKAEKLLEPGWEIPYYRGKCAIKRFNHRRVVYFMNKALGMNPMLPQARRALFVSCTQIGRFATAAVDIVNWSKLPNQDEVYDVKLRFALLRGGMFDVAWKIPTKYHPEHPYYWFYNAFSSHITGDLDSAIEDYQKASALMPENESIHVNRGMALLLAGRLREGWQQYASRFLTRTGDLRRVFAEPEWNGESLVGKQLFVHTEQGLGDVIMFLRFFPLLQKMGGKIIFESYTDIVALLKVQEGAEVLPEDTKIELKFDYQIPLMNLAKMFASEFEDIPNAPYLSAPREESEIWKKRLNGPELKIGLVWAGNPDHNNDYNRSSSLSDYLPLADIPGVKLYSIQKGPSEILAEYPPVGMLIENLSKEITSFTDTAAMISALDIVLCIDTSVAHLAAAMGKPVWLLLPYYGDWRWTRKGSSTPWYPSMRIFRQQGATDWSEVIAEVKEALLDHLASLPPRPSVTVELSPEEQANQDRLQRFFAFQKTAEQLWKGKDESGLAMLLQGVGAEFSEAPQYQYWAAQLLRRDEQWEAAAELYEKVIRAIPRYPEARINLGLCQWWQGYYIDALGHFEYAAVTNKKSELAWKYLGWYLEKIQALEVAVYVLQHAIGVFPGSADLRLQLAEVYRRLGEFEKAIELAWEARTIRPDHPDVEIHLTLNQASLHDWVGYDELWADIYRKHSGNPQLELQYAMRQLELGNWEEGWAHWESRLAALDADTIGRKCPNANVPKWTGDPLNGRKLLVYGEQGFGDCLNFAHFAARIEGDVTLAVHRSLLALFEASNWPTKLIAKPEAVEAIDQYDCYADLMSLPLLLKAGGDLAPRVYPYVKPDFQDHALVNALPKTDLPKVGLIWGGNQYHRNTRWRDCPFEQLFPLIDRTDISWVSMQKDRPSDIVLFYPEKQEKLFNGGILCESWYDTACLIDQLDLVITVDTALAHLAASMGKPVWLMVAKFQDWRWGHHDETTLWYPSVRIFRQQKAGEWEPVIGKINAALDELVWSRQ